MNKSHISISSDGYYLWGQGNQKNIRYLFVQLKLYAEICEMLSEREKRKDYQKHTRKHNENNII